MLGGVIIPQASLIYQSLINKNTKEVNIDIQDKPDINKIMDEILTNNWEFRNIEVVIGDGVAQIPVTIWDWENDVAIFYKIVAVRYDHAE
jgi:hypothetical protein